MKHLTSVILAACALAISSPAQDAKTNAAAAAAPIQSFSATNAVLTAPLVLNYDYIYLAAAEMADVTNGGKAVFSFTVTNSGSYVIEALADAEDDNSNSFFVNFDAVPQGPDMIWDIDVTSGFEKRTVGWRGSGDASNVEFPSKHFKLTAGTHKLIIVGREPGTQLKSLSILPAPPEQPATP